MNDYFTSEQMQEDLREAGCSDDQQASLKLVKSKEELIEWVLANFNGSSREDVTHMVNMSQEDIAESRESLWYHGYADEIAETSIIWAMARAFGMNTTPPSGVSTGCWCYWGLRPHC